MSDMHKFGDATGKAVVFKSESHKLHHSLPVKTGETVKKGQPVVLNTDGTIQGFKTGNSLSMIIGYAVTDSANPAYQSSKQYGVVEVTVALKGYGILYGVSAADGQVAGKVIPTGSLDATGVYTEYQAEGTPATTNVNFIALNGGDEGELIHILVV